MRRAKRICKSNRKSRKKRKGKKEKISMKLEM